MNLENQIGSHINVGTGEIRTGSGCDILLSNGIGSCIVVGIVDPIFRIGGLAHLMLPGKCRHFRSPECYKYIEDGLDHLLNCLVNEGCNLEHADIYLAGAGNVLHREDDTICKSNINSVFLSLSSHNLGVKATSLGGHGRRKVKLDIEHAQFWCAVNDDDERILV